MPSFILTHLLVIEHKNNITTVNIHLIDTNVNAFSYLKYDFNDSPVILYYNNVILIPIKKRDKNCEDFLRQTRPTMQAGFRQSKRRTQSGVKKTAKGFVE